MQFSNSRHRDSGIENSTLHRRPRCRADPEYIAYHDTKWAVSAHDDRRLFEMLVLEGMQNRLSWITIPRKRPAFHAAFEGFDPDEVKLLLANPDIIRSRVKVEAAITNDTPGSGEIWEPRPVSLGLYQG